MFLMLNTPFIRNASLLIARLPVGIMFVMAGWSKIGGYAGTQKFMESASVPGALLPLVIATELVFGLMLLAGFKTRHAALALAGFTLIATFLFHFKLSDQVQFLFFMKNMSITGLLLALVAAGAGAWSVDGNRGE
jgi:putative oxidoreductase